MYATEVINANIDAVKLLEYYDFKSIKKYGNFIRSCCGIHNGNNPTGFVYNIINNTWYCHTGKCGGGDVYDLVKILEQCSFKQAVEKLAEIFNIDISNLELTHIKTENEKEREEWMKLVKETNVEIKEFNFTSSELKPIKKFRHYKQETLEYFGAKYVEEFTAINNEGNEYILQKRILIPILYVNVMVGVSLRRVVNTDIQKWSHQGFESKHFLYNYDNCIKYISENNIDEIILVEGIFDVWNFYEQGIYNVVATFGAHLTDEQEMLLLKHCTTLVLAYDNDNAGIECTIKIINKTKYKFDLYFIQFDNNSDPGSSFDLKERYKNKQIYTNFGGNLCLK